MATDEQWQLVKELRARVEALEQLHQAVVDLNERFSLEPLEARVKALESLNCVSAILKLTGRVDALEANMNGIAWAFDQHAAKWQQDEDVERVVGAPPIATNEEILRVYWAGGDSPDARLRCVYDLGRQHGAAANSKPSPNFLQIGSSADTGLLPMIVSETGSDDEPETERIICSAISGGADYVNGMPRELSLERIRDGDSISARYVQTPSEVAGAPAEVAPAVELMEMLADVWSEGKPLHPAARRAAIRMVAKWLEQQQEVPISATASAYYFAAMLRSEANR